MTKLVAVVARADNGVIGHDGALPWRIPADLRRVKALTMGKPLIMGRRTFESLPGLLPGRRHVVLTRDPAWQVSGVEVAHSVDDAIAIAGGEEAIVFGGAEVYRLFADRIDRVELTEIHAATPGDTVLPPFDPAEWRETFREEHPAEDGRPAFAFVTLERRAV